MFKRISELFRKTIAKNSLVRKLSQPQFAAIHAWNAAIDAKRSAGVLNDAKHRAELFAYRKKQTRESRQFWKAVRKTVKVDWMKTAVHIPF